MAKIKNNEGESALFEYVTRLTNQIISKGLSDEEMKVVEIGNYDSPNLSL